MTSKGPFQHKAFYDSVYPQPLEAKQKGYLFEAGHPRLTKPLPCLKAEQGSCTIRMPPWTELGDVATSDPGPVFFDICSQISM